MTNRDYDIGVPPLWWGDLQIGPQSSGFTLGLKSLRTGEVNLFFGSLPQEIANDAKTVRSSNNDRT